MFLTKKRKAKLCKALRKTRLSYLPFSLGIDPGNICNLKCPLCPTGESEPGVKRGFMDLELFKRIFDQLKDSLQVINLYNWGEPLLNTNLVDIIRHVKGKNNSIRIITSTNLNVRNSKLLEELVNSGIDDIIVSCDGASKETYEKYRVGGNFDLVMENMRFLLSKNKELDKKAKIIWNFLVFKHNEHEVNIAKNMANEMGVNLTIGLMRTSLKDEIRKTHKEAIEHDKAWIPDNPEYSAYDKDKCATKKVLKTCRKPWETITISWDGLVFPCCAVFGESYNFGDAKNEPIKKIWNNQKFIRARQEILNKKLPATTICGICRNNGFMHM